MGLDIHQRKKGTWGCGFDPQVGAPGLAWSPQTFQLRGRSGGRRLPAPALASRAGAQCLLHAPALPSHAAVVGAAGAPAFGDPRAGGDPVVPPARPAGWRILVAESVVGAPGGADLGRSPPLGGASGSVTRPQEPCGPSLRPGRAGSRDQSQVEDEGRRSHWALGLVCPSDTANCSSGSLLRSPQDVHPRLLAGDPDPALARTADSAKGPNRAGRGGLQRPAWGPPGYGRDSDIHPGLWLCRCPLPLCCDDVLVRDAGAAGREGDQTRDQGAALYRGWGSLILRPWSQGVGSTGPTDPGPASPGGHAAEGPAKDWKAMLP